ncbi:hypothetical protein V8E36_009046 [Tilletia maclaganii]
MMFFSQNEDDDLAPPSGLFPASGSSASAGPSAQLSWSQFSAFTPASQKAAQAVRHQVYNLAGRDPPAQPTSTLLSDIRSSSRVPVEDSDSDSSSDGDDNHPRPPQQGTRSDQCATHLSPDFRPVDPGRVFDEASAASAAILQSAAALASMSAPPQQTGTQPMHVPVKDPCAAEWPLLLELRYTPARFYRGPLTPSQVLRLLGTNTTLSKNGRNALTGTSGGYLAFFHFLGPQALPANRHRPSMRGGATHTSPTTLPTAHEVGKARMRPAKVKDEAREAWKCRACQTTLHIPRYQVSNLGTHLFGTRSKPERGCLHLRGDRPAEPLPPFSRGPDGLPLRIAASK